MFKSDTQSFKIAAQRGGIWREMRGRFKREGTYVKLLHEDLPGRPGVGPLCFHCRHRGFNALVGDLGSHMLCGVAKKKKKSALL